MTHADGERFVLDAGDGHRIHARRWLPAGDAAGVIQVLHGLGEHAGRYARFAAAANERGFALVVHDHRGHGGHDDDAFYFAPKNGWQRLGDDALQVFACAREDFPGVPVALLGHSMGSFLAQQFAMDYGDRLGALLLSGSTWASRLEVGAGHLLARAECLRLDPLRVSGMLDWMGFGKFNRRFRPARTELDWLSRDATEVDRYVADPLCGGPYTAGLWRDLTAGLWAITSDEALARIPSSLPVLITGGEHDPVGGDRGMGNLAMHYAQTGHSRLRVRIYPEGRHEMLNETNRDEVTRDWLDWIAASLK